MRGAFRGARGKAREKWGVVDLETRTAWPQEGIQEKMLPGAGGQ